MSRFAHVLVVCLLLAAALLIHCSKDKPTAPPDSTVSISGDIVLPGTTGVNQAGITLTFGSHEAQVDSSHHFTVVGNAHVPGLATVTDGNEKPLLMQIVCDPDKGVEMHLDAHSTALALAFLNPFVCVCNKDHAKSALEKIATLQSFHRFETSLSDKLHANATALSSDNAELDSLLSNVVLDYVNSFTNSTLDSGFKSKNIVDNLPPSRLETAPEIVPSTTKGGHKIAWEGGDNFKLWNDNCRWAYCTTPTDSFFVFPSGDFIDWYKGNQPWPPSSKGFKLQVTPGGDTARINIYGYGFLVVPENSWHNLSMDEREKAHWGGMMTMTFELVRHILGVVCQIDMGVNKATLSDQEKDEIRLMQMLLGQSGVAQRITMYIEANDPWGCGRYMTKQILLQLSSSESFRAAFSAVTGIAITNVALKAIGKYLTVVAQGVVTFNNVTQAMRAALGFNSTYFKTSFKVWKEYTDFGAVEGHVGDKQSGQPVVGALVKVIGDENNPMHPVHELISDQTGYFRFDNIGVGEKSLTATKAGYDSKTVDITIEKNKTIDVDIVMEKQSGGLTGKVINDILQHHNVDPPCFADAVDINGREIGGTHRQLTTSAFNGAYTLTVPVGNWWMVASHDDYKSDSFEVNVQQAGNFNAPRDLVLKPDPTMSVHAYINEDNQGSYELDYTYTASQVGLSKPALDPDECHYGGTPQNVMMGQGMRGNSNSDFDQILIGFTTDLISQAGDYEVGGADYWGCSGHEVTSTVIYQTTRYKCKLSGSGQYPMIFGFDQDPASLGCDCGVSAPGSIFLTKWGTELGDVVAGAFTIDLAGWNGCGCGGDDTNGDGVVDKWDVSCAQVRINVDFHFLVGTDYLVTFKPGSSPQIRGVTNFGI